MGKNGFFISNTYMELHLSIVVIVVHTEDLVVGQYVEQLPLPLVHEDALVLPEFLGASHQGDVNVINYEIEHNVGSSVKQPWQQVTLHPPLNSLSTCHSGRPFTDAQNSTVGLLKS